ncbi:MAG: cytochrome c family protein [Alphaproteobacteria bacterium]|nr:c-type cytochrome [Alphaproteobacteria bacterium]TAD87270.1 MAG: cytochrome c family protein [Alphaproteobacteria bacterium]
MRAPTLALMLTVAGLALSAPAFAEGNPEKGEAVFRSKCRSCHQIGETARNGVGPVQNGIVGRAAGTVAGFAYSPLNKAAGEAGLTWTPENITAYLPDPNTFLRTFITGKGGTVPAGVTKMTYRLNNAQEIADVIAYLAKN